MVLLCLALGMAAGTPSRTVAAETTHDSSTTSEPDLTVEENAVPEHDDVLTDDPLIDEDVSLPAAFLLEGGRSYTFNGSGERVYFSTTAKSLSVSAATGST